MNFPKSKRVWAGGLTIGLLIGGAVGVVVGNVGVSSAQTNPAPSVTSANPATPAPPQADTDQGDKTWSPNTDPAHEATETPEHEADEKSGKFHGDGHHGRSNHDAAHEANESAEHAAEEAARDLGIAADTAPRSSTAK